MSKEKIPSMVYQVTHYVVDNSKRSKTGSGDISSGSAKQYRRAAINFGNWSKKTFGIKLFSDCEPHIQDYADYLFASGKKPCTIHTYLAGVCLYFDVTLDEIKKPKRISAHNTRSRGTPAVDARSDAKREASPRLYDFASKVGIRRAEYQRLRGDDLVEDESGYLRIYDLVPSQLVVRFLYENGIVTSEIRSAKINLEEYYVDLMREKEGR